MENSSEKVEAFSDELVIRERQKVGNAEVNFSIGFGKRRIERYARWLDEKKAQEPFELERLNPEYARIHPLASSFFFIPRLIILWSINLGIFQFSNISHSPLVQ